MSLSQINSLIADLERLASDANLARAALSVYAQHAPRIFEQGKAADGSPIGSYSTDPTYINPADSPQKFSPVGKTGRSTFKNGKPHVTRYFGGGYKQFRATVGRESGTVNLDLFGDMRRNYVAGWVGAQKYAYGFVNPAEAAKAEGNEKRFQKEVFALTEEEIDLFEDLITNPIE